MAKKSKAAAKPRKIPPDEKRCTYIFPDSDSERAGSRCTATRSRVDPDYLCCWGHAQGGKLAREASAKGTEKKGEVKKLLSEVQTNRAQWNKEAQAEFGIYTMEDVFTLLCGEFKYYSEVKPSDSKRLKVIDMMITCRKSLLGADSRTKEVRFVNKYEVKGGVKNIEDIPNPFPEDE